MNADVLFSYLLGMDGVLLTSCAVVIAIVAVVELGTELWDADDRHAGASRSNSGRNGNGAAPFLYGHR